MLRKQKHALCAPVLLVGYALNVTQVLVPCQTCHGLFLIGAALLLHSPRFGLNPSFDQDPVQLRHLNASPYFDLRTFLNHPHLHDGNENPSDLLESLQSYPCYFPKIRIWLKVSCHYVFC
mgnify:CR=1 FL=1